MNRFHAWSNKRINWAGFYLLAPLFPGTLDSSSGPTLWLGPFCGLPACQSIPSIPGRGVCADGSAKWPPTVVCVPHTGRLPYVVILTLPFSTMFFTHTLILF